MICCLNVVLMFKLETSLCGMNNDERIVRRYVKPVLTCHLMTGLNYINDVIDGLLLIQSKF